jgi:hypothetical protein
MGIECESHNVEDEFGVLCKRLSQAQDEESFFAVLDEVTEYLTRQYYSRQAGRTDGSSIATQQVDQSDGG